MAQIQAKQHDNDRGQGKAPGDDIRFMASQVDQRRVIDPINDKPVGVGKRVVVVPGVRIGIVELAFAAGHSVHQRFTDVGFK